MGKGRSTKTEQQVATPTPDVSASQGGPGNAARQSSLGGLEAPKEPRGGESYVVREGDTLESIAIAVYGDAAYAFDIEAANFNQCGGDAQLTPGQTLDLPQLDVAIASVDPSTQVCEAPPEPAAGPPTQVSNHIKDGPYGWDSKYEVSFTGAECRLNVKVKVSPQAGVSAEEAERIKTDTASAFASIWDRRFSLTDTTSKETFTLRVGITYVDSGEHLAIDLHPGNRRNDLTTWSVERPVSTRAHELGHQLGLKDEYVDPAVDARKDATAPGVHTDHSIMGNYHAEGYAQAEAKQRHGDVIGGHIGQAAGRTFTISTLEKK